MLINRLYQYQKERFPVFQYLILIFFFYYGFFGISKYFIEAKLLFEPKTIICALTIFLIFFQLRLFDEIKDYDIDSKYMPERAVPRGLISLKEIKTMLLITTLLMFILNVFVGLSNFIVFTLMEFYIFLMGKEFFIGKNLKKNRLIYASLHMVVMSWIGFYIIHNAVPLRYLNLKHLLLIVLSYVIGFIMEIARKIEAPQNERDGVDTYSKLMGYKETAFLVVILSIISEFILLWIFNFNNYIFIIVLLSIIPMIGAIIFLIEVNKRGSKIIENSASLYTLSLVIFFFIVSLMG
jgi:4-hydroxybenzoate polyprenyltransferase